MATLPSEMVGHSPFLPDPAAAYGREEGLKSNEVDVEFLGHSLEHLVKVDRNLVQPHPSQEKEDSGSISINDLFYQQEYCSPIKLQYDIT